MAKVSEEKERERVAGGQSRLKIGRYERDERGLERRRGGRVGSGLLERWAY